jgi:Helix-turn-helix domain
VARSEDRRQVGDVRALSALAHPVRTALLNHLMAVGPRTASECAPVVDASASNCSWHLRQLARYGFVEDAGSADGRERRWRAAATGFQFTAEGPAGRAAEETLASVQLAEEERLTRMWLRGADDEPAAWRDRSGLSTYGLLMSPAELGELHDRLDALIRPYIALTREDAPDDARPVHLGVRAFRRPEEAP